MTLDGQGFAARVERISVDGAVAHVDLTTPDGIRFEAQVSREQGRTLTAGTVTHVAVRNAHVFPV
jgi:sulfate transport system ATP-binding protein